MKVNGKNASFAKLLEYEKRSQQYVPGKRSGGGPSREWSGVTFSLGDAQLACNINRITEILPFPQATPVPGAKPWILGLANVRGSLLTVVDLAWYLTGVRSPVTARSRLLTTVLNKAPIGLLIDEVLGQRHFLESDAAPAELPEDSFLSGIISHQHCMGTEIWNEVDLDRLFNSVEFLNGAAE